MADTEVLIVGAGPVGLTLAVALGLKGVRCTLIEQKEAPEFLPKMERCNARTMEIYRRMGLAERIRAAGLDGRIPMDVYIVLAMNEPPPCTCLIRRWRRRGPRSTVATTARCRSSRISSSRNTRSSRS